MNRGTLATAALLALGLAAAANAQTEYQVTVDTSAISSTTGNLEFQFNPTGGAQPATVTITGFTPGSGLSGSPTLTGGAAGSLPGTVTLTNSTGFNDYFQGYTFGNSLTFDATFSGPALTPPAGTTGSSTFAFSLFDSAGTTPLLTNAPNGAVAEITINPDGSFSTQANPNASGGPSVASITFVPAAVPEPGSVALLLGMATIGVSVLRKRRKQSAPSV